MMQDQDNLPAHKRTQNDDADADANGGADGDGGAGKEELNGGTETDGECDEADITNHGNLMQTWLLMKNIWRGKMGSPKFTIAEILLPLYPILILLLIRSVNAIPNEKIQIPGEPEFPAVTLVQSSLAALQVYQAKPSLLAFAPNTSTVAMNAREESCQILSIGDCDLTQTFESREIMDDAWHNEGILAGISFAVDESEGSLNGSITVHHRPTAELFLNFTQELQKIFPPTQSPTPAPTSVDNENPQEYERVTEESAPPDFNTEEVMLFTGITLLQAVATSVANPNTAAGLLLTDDFKIQQFPIFEREEVRLFLQFLFAMMFIGAFFLSMQITLAGLGNEMERGLRLQLRLKSMRRLPYWAAWFLATAAVVVLAACVFTIALYATRTMEHTNPGFMLLLSVLFVLAQQAFSLMVVPFFGEQATGKNLFLVAISFVILFQMLFFIVYFALIEQNAPDAAIHASFLLFVVPFVYVMFSTATPEVLGRGVSWDSAPYIEAAFIMLFVDILLYLTICVLVDSFMDWKRASASRTRYNAQLKHSSTYDGASSSLAAPFEQHQGASYGPSHQNRGFKLRNLTKVFQVTEGQFPFTKTSKLRAVDDVSLDVGSNQIFALLGHNGAGKSTLINMLIGKYLPTSGHAWVSGMHIVADRDELRQSLGVCPQFDVLYDNVSCQNQLELLARISGKSESAAKRQIRQLLRELKLEEKADELAGTLSGGQKRRLSLAIALVGDPKVVLLDECTTGLDPGTRRQVWRLLHRLKAERTIILTTHAMEEAEQLGDMVGIMSKGKLQALGSTLELTSDHGTGYRLHCVRPTVFGSEGDVEAIEQVISRHVSGFKRRTDVGSEISFSLPSDELNQFAGLFAEMEEKKDSLGIVSFGVEPPSLEDAFLKLAEDDKHKEEANEANEDDNKGQEKSLVSRALSFLGCNCPQASASASGNDDPENQERQRPGYGRFGQSFENEPVAWRQMYAVISQVFLHASRSPTTLCYLVVAPILMSLLVAGLSFALSPSKPSPSPMELLNANGTRLGDSQDLAPGFVPYFVPESGEAEPEVEVLLGDIAQSEPSGNYSERVAFYESLNETSGFNGAIAIEELNLTENVAKGTIMYNKTANTSLRAMIAQLQAGLIDSGRSGPEIVEYVEFQGTLNQNDLQGGGLMYFLASAFTFLAALYAEEIVRVRETRMKDMLLLGGLPRFGLWFSYLNAHFWLLMLSAVISYIVMNAFGMSGVEENPVLAYLILFAAFGPANIFFAYCLSFLVKTTQQAQQFLGEPLQIVLLIPWIVVTFALEETSIALENVLTIFIPGFGLYRGFAILQFSATNDDPFSLADLFEWDRNYIQVVLMLLVSGLFYGGILTLLEAERFRPVRDCLHPKNCLNMCLIAISCRKRGSVDDAADDYSHMDEDQILASIMKDDDKRLPRPKTALPENIGNDDVLPVLSHGLRKSFAQQKNTSKRFHALKGVSLGVNKGRIFGLLGANGAGKSTWISCMTGMENMRPDGGEGWIMNKSILTEQEEARQKSGLCPQFDALLPLLTGREHLRMFARIRGIPSELTERLCQHYINMLDLNLKADSTAGNYSGGNKRKLSVALSMLSASAIFLDEPSTGLDPGTRRFMWDFLSGAKEDKGVILTTHSMEEADALSSSIAIMVSGAIRAAGTSQELKHELGGEYKVVARVVPGENCAKHILELLRTISPDAKVAKEDRADAGRTATHEDNLLVGDPNHSGADDLHDVNHLSVIKFVIPASHSEISLAKLFDVLNREASRVGLIGFSVAQTSLEDAFLRLSSMQETSEG